MKKLSAFLCFFLGIFSMMYSNTVELSNEEYAYLKNLGEIRMAVDPDWLPFEIIDEKGEFKGIAADLVQLVADRLAIAITLIPTQDWSETLKLSREGHVHLLPFLNKTLAREEWLVFTEPLFTDPNVLITREDMPYIPDPKELYDRSIVVVAKTMIEERVRKDFPNLKVITVETEEECFAMVSEKKADMTLRSLTIAAYTIRKQGYFNLKINNQIPEYKNFLRMGVLKTEPMLRDILNKGIATITLYERDEIVNRHVNIKIEKPFNYALLIRIGIVLIIFGSALVYWNFRLRKLNAIIGEMVIRDSLTNVYNRRYIYGRLAELSAEYIRIKRNFSIAILDIDHFKEINDTYGHQAGDFILRSFCEFIAETLRAYELLGRYGGEEFIIVSPNSTKESIAVLLERLLAGIRSKHFTFEKIDISIQFSAGIADCRELNDGHFSVESLIKMADRRLYTAKRLGRNRIQTEDTE